MDFSTGFLDDDTEFFDGLATSPLVPYSYTIALNGVEFMVDQDQPFYRQMRRQVASVIRTQADTSTDPGEQSLDPNGLWRRSFEDWSLGAGQRYLDRKASVPNSFWSSKGIDALTTKWQFSLLPATTQPVVSSAFNGHFCLQVGGYIYYTDDTDLYFTAGGLAGVGSGTLVTGLPAGKSISSMATDGASLWVCVGSDGVYVTAAGGASAAQYVTSAVSTTAQVGFVNGRLMLASGLNIYNVIAGGALPAALFTVTSGEFGLDPTSSSGLALSNQMWAGGNANFYVAWTNGPLSYIYGFGIASDGTTINPPTIQGQLPLGEQVTSLLNYLGNLIVGTSLGVRFCQVSASGAISLGSLIPTPQSVLCLAASGRFVWFGWSGFDSESSGLGRMDLENFVVEGVLPAYASDIMAVGLSSPITSALIFYNGAASQAMFGMAFHGFFVTDQTGDLVQSGTVDSGYILYDLVDTKIATLLDVRTVGPLEFGSYSASVSADGGTFNQVGTHMAGDAEPVSFGVNVPAERFEVSLTLNRDLTTPTAGPVVTRWTLRAYPAPVRPLTWQLPLIINEEETNLSGASYGFSSLDLVEMLEGFVNSRSLVTYQEGEKKYSVFVSDHAFLPDAQTEDKSYFNGVSLITLLGIPGNT